MARSFVHLHVHSEYSLLDGACKHDRLLDLAQEYGMPALAVTDHGNLFGAMEFYKKARKRGVKPILGCEVYTVPGGGAFEHRKRGRENKKTNHLVLLCKSALGYQNLSRLVSRGYMEGFYYKPRVSKAMLRELSEGLICTSACLQGEVAQHVVQGRYDQARASLVELRDIFGEGNLYVELQKNGVADQEIANEGLISLATELGLPLLATCDVHYLRPEDKLAHDVLLCINTGKQLDDPKRLRIDADIHFRSVDEVYEAFGPKLEEAVRNTVDVAKRCQVELETGRKYLPVYHPEARAPETAPETPEAMFERLCAEGAARRYQGQAQSAAVQERLAIEQDVIRSMGFVSYFLIVWDFIRWAKRERIPVGPGRGSAAGSIVAYCLGITDVCPLKYDLLFERFLNKERVSMPDIDIDFCQERRQEVIEYVRRKYGHDAVSQIITFGTMAAKSVIRDVCRALAVPLADADRVAKLVPTDLQVRRKKLKDALEEVAELREVVETDARFQQVFEIATRLEGLARNASTHAAGVVIGDGPLIERVPLYRDPKHPDDIVTQFSMSFLEEECGLLKMDFLGLKTLTVIKWCLDLVEETEGRRPSVAMEDLPLDEVYSQTERPDVRKVYELLQAGATKGVFQFESQGYRDLLSRLKPDSFQDVIALGAMYRPGPLGAGMVDAYVERKHGREEVTYLHPLLERVLGETYGCMLYQEQVMRITNVLAGFTLNEADTLRKAMGKKKPEVMARFKGKFLDGAETNGCSRDDAEKIWEQMEFFAGYGFNKSHSTAYALVTFQTAWLKALYPEEFMAGLLSSEVRTIDKVVDYIDECRRMGIEVLPPDVNSSGLRFKVVRVGGSKKICYGLIAVKGVGEAPVGEILRARTERGAPFQTLFDLTGAVDTKLVNKSCLEALIRSGATRGLRGNRAQQLALVEKALAHGQRLARDRRAGQRSLFGAFGGGAAAALPEPPLPDVPELTEKEILQCEKETLGFFLTSHPLNRHRERIRRFATHTAATIPEAQGDVLVCGMLTEVRRRQDRRGRQMAFISVEGIEGSFGGVVFSRVFEAAKAHLEPERIVFLRGSVDQSRKEPSLKVSEVIPVEEADRVFALQVKVRLRAGALTDDTLMALANALLEHPGTVPVVLELETRTGIRCQLKTHAPFLVEPSERLERSVDRMLGRGACSVQGALTPSSPEEGPPRGSRERGRSRAPVGAVG